MESLKKITKKECCFTCAHYNSGQPARIGFMCTKSSRLRDYRDPEDNCKFYRNAKKSDKQYEYDYESLEINRRKLR